MLESDGCLEVDAMHMRGNMVQGGWRGTHAACGLAPIGRWRPSALSEGLGMSTNDRSPRLPDPRRMTIPLLVLAVVVGVATVVGVGMMVHDHLALGRSGSPTFPFLVLALVMGGLSIDDHVGLGSGDPLRSPTEP